MSQFPGICFGPYLTQPLGSPLSDDRIIQLLSTLSGRTQWIRTYGSGGDLKKIPQIAKQMGFKVAAGAWIDGNNQNNNREIRDLADNVNRGYVDLAIVGSEVILRRDLNVSNLINFINQFRGLITGSSVKVTSADTLGSFQEFPQLVSNLDILMVHLYPYFGGVGINQAEQFIIESYQATIKISENKPVWIGESGWPTSGPSKNNAHTSEDISARYADWIRKWSNDNNIIMFYFEAFDENWKTEDGVGKHWGIWNSDGKIKNGFSHFFNNSKK
eukprot:TRINITY_DN14018_c0_g1_i1.p1 TRINITY_DN14018_c0_g1~~TRINITY_DN14018_c0_g1_i1.p1  ORF type:complete len:273 (+),score=44.29 TRINITY_DN14018_c0_g1_i1:33-851(+)